MNVDRAPILTCVPTSLHFLPFPLSKSHFTEASAGSDKAAKSETPPGKE